MKSLLFAAAFATGLFILADATWAQTWTLTSAPPEYWHTVASSADGTKLVVAVNRGPIYTSADGGGSWTLTSAPTNAIWESVAASADGSRLVAVAYSSPIYTSTNSGVDWTNTASPSESWSCVASSLDGSHLVAAARSGTIYASMDSGATWTNTFATNKIWTSVASSADGSKLVAVPTSGHIYFSLDFGSTWISPVSPADGWSGVAMSANGNKIVAVASSGSIYTFPNFSTNNSSNATVIIAVDASGTNWTTGDTNMIPHWTKVNTNGPIKLWVSVASSSDGTTLLAAPSSGQLYTSTNSGATWTNIYVSTNSGGSLTNSNTPSAFWSAVACSADGGTLIAAAVTNSLPPLNSGGIYTFQSAPVLSLALKISTTNGAISWPSSASPVTLEETSDWTATNWRPVTATPTVTNGQNRVIVPPTSGNRFYRLKKP